MQESPHNLDPGRLFQSWARRGRTRDLAQVFESTAPGLLRLARHLTGDLADAEDVLQSTFVTAMRKAQDYDPARPLEAWLTGILRRHAQEIQAKQRRNPDPDRVPTPSPSPDPVAAARHAELDRELQQAIDRLQANDRALLLLELRHGLAPAEIAEVLDRAPGTVRVQLHRARERLRRLLPAGVASSLVLGAPLHAVRGLDAVQRDVLALAAARSPSAWPTGSLLAQAALMKLVSKTGAAIAAVLFLSVGLVLVWEPGATNGAPPTGQLETEQELGAAANESGVSRGTVTPSRVSADSDRSVSTSLEDPLVVLTTVRRDDGSPMPGIALLVEPDDERHPSLHRRTVITGDDGRAELPGLAPGRYRVLADRAPDVSKPVSASEKVSTESEQLHPATETDLPIRSLPSGDGITGYYVHDLDDLVHALGPDSPRLQVSGYVDLGNPEIADELVAELDDVDVERMRAFEVDEYANAPAPSRIAAQFTVPDSPTGDPSQEIAIPLTPGVAVAGRVVTPAGEPAPNAEICLVVPGEQEARQGLARTDAEGRFRFRDLAPGTQLYAQQFEGFLRGPSVTVKEGGGELLIKLTKSSGSIRGVVRDSAGAPIPNANVRVGKPHSYSGAIRMKTDEEGRFGPVEIGEFPEQVLVQHPGHEPWGALVQVAAGQERQLDVHLEDGWQLEGRLLQGAGEPAAGIRIQAIAKDRPTTSTMSDREGRYRFECLPVGAVLIRVRASPGWRHYEESVRGVAGELQTRDLRRPRAGRIRIELVDGRGRPLRDWLVRAQPTTDKSWKKTVTGRVGNDGLVSLDTWPEHDYRIQVQPGTRQLIEITYKDGPTRRFLCHQTEPMIFGSQRRIAGKELGVDQLPGIVDRLRVTVPDRFLPTARVRARFVDATGKPVQGSLWIDLPDASGSIVRTDDDGEADTGLLVPGPYTFRFEPDGADDDSSIPLDLTELLPNQVIDLGNIRVDV